MLLRRRPPAGTGPATGAAAAVVGESAAGTVTGVSVGLVVPLTPLTPPLTGIEEGLGTLGAGTITCMHAWGPAQHSVLGALCSVLCGLLSICIKE